MHRGQVYPACRDPDLTLFGRPEDVVKYTFQYCLLGFLDEGQDVWLECLSVGRRALTSPAVLDRTKVGQ